MEHSPTVALAATAMATRFEIVLYGDDPVRLRAAGEEALAEIERLDGQLSRFNPASDVSCINARAAYEPVKVEPRLFWLLRRAAEINKATEGAFDITVSPLIRIWDITGAGRVPSSSELMQTRAIVGMNHVRLDESAFTVSFDAPGVEIDLGAIGKGYAVDCAVEILRGAGIVSALIHGGTSTVCALGNPPDEDGWNIAVNRGGETTQRLVFTLRDSSLSVSDPHGRFFEHDGQRYGHIIDPRTGGPAQCTTKAVVIGPSATETDALSTALLLLGESWLPELGVRFPGFSGTILPLSGGSYKGRM